ncbi:MULTISPECIES: spore germination protein [Paenibacillus]|uniref:spore germination protein n=1 Tax=Paenibacillus TaxID=44249 RepID=UPI002FDF7331
MVDKGNQGSDKNLPSDLSQSVEIVRNRLGKSSDFKAREIILPGQSSPVAAICYFNGLVDLKSINKMIATVNDYLLGEKQGDPSPSSIEDIIPGDLRKSGNIDNLIQALLDGSTVMLIDGLPSAAIVSLPGGKRRAVEEPSSQTVIRGPKEGFTEDVATNIALIRRKIRSPELRFEDRTIGRVTKTRVSVAYIKGIAKDEVVKEVFTRLDRIDVDSILESGYIEEYIQDTTATPFPTLINTERPDAVAGNLLDGQVAILVDGSPFVLVAPVTFFKFFLASEDYYQRYDISSFLRLIRLFSFLMALLLPSLYIAVTTFQQEMIPTTLLISLAAQREGTPLPALLEALLMELTFEVIREAGVRMPRVVGPAISIVGALVLGQAAVQAGLVSAAMVIIVSFTAISNFVIPYFSMSAAVRLVRFGLMLLAGTFGLYGILAGGIPLLVHMISLRSFGVPYFLPLSPLSFNNLKDVLIRAPWPLLKTRPSHFSANNRVRQSSTKREKKTN